MSSVLVVDDDVDLARVVADVLQDIGYVVRTAANGAEGLVAIAEEKPDVILLDVEMPVLDGPSMAYELIVLDAGRELIPLVLSSGYSELQSVAESLGTPYFVRKPCTIDDLASAIRRACSERRPPRPSHEVYALRTRERAP